jgi:hypothetical protein
MSFTINGLIAGVVAAAGLFAGPVLAQQVKPPCTDDSRDCMISAAKAYLDSIVTHDASKVPAAPAIKRTEQGRVTATGEQNLRESQKLQPDMDGHKNTRFFVDEKTHNVIAYTLLRVTGQNADPNRKTFVSGRPASEAKPSTVHLAERFKVEKGLVTEIEAIFTIETGSMDGTSNWPD